MDFKNLTVSQIKNLLNEIEIIDENIDEVILYVQAYYSQSKLLLINNQVSFLKYPCCPTHHPILQLYIYSPNSFYNFSKDK